MNILHQYADAKLNDTLLASRFRVFGKPLPKARSIRIEYAADLHQAIAWGNRRAPVYRDSDGRRFFLKALARAL